MPRPFARSGLVGTVRRAVAHYGVLGFLRMAWGKVARGGGTGRVFPLDSLADPGEAHPFDREHGVDTSGLIPAETLHSDHENVLWAVAYYGIAPSVFDGLMAKIEGFDPSRFTFVDLGSGKGRALMLASRFPFQEIVGVELSPDLHRAAEANLARFRPDWRRCENVRSVEGDATTVEFPPTPLVVFLNNPFLPPLLRACLENLRHSYEANPREIVVLYVNPDFDRVFARFPLFERRWHGALPMDATDAAADRFVRTQEPATVYRVASGPL